MKNSLIFTQVKSKQLYMKYKKDYLSVIHHLHMFLKRRTKFTRDVKRSAGGCLYDRLIYRRITGKGTLKKQLFFDCFTNKTYK